MIEAAEELLQEVAGEKSENEPTERGFVCSSPSLVSCRWMCLCQHPWHEAVLSLNVYLHASIHPHPVDGL